MHDNDDDRAAGGSGGSTFFEVLQARLSRRDILKGAAALITLSTLPAGLAGCAATGTKRTATLGFTSVPVSTADAVRVPEGYSATAFYRWGDPIGHPSGSPAFKPDAGNTADEQALQAGMHHDGIHYFPLPYGSESSGARSR